VSRAWEAIPSYRPGQERVAVVPKRNVIREARDVWLATADIHEARQEHVLVFRHRVIARRVVAIGPVSGVDVHPREVFRPAIANAAAAILLVHNHPSGEEQPSSQDREITTRLRDAGQLLGIPLLDHVVVSVGGYHSLIESTT
jgi:DNA repair protein RadC